jgi:hypothetical protein
VRILDLKVGDIGGDNYSDGGAETKKYYLYYKINKYNY